MALMRNALRIRLYARMWLIVLLSALFLAGAVFLLMIEKGDLVLALQARHSATADRIVWFVNLLGDGWTLLIVALLLFFVNIRAGFQLLLSAAFTGLLILVLKKVIYPDAMRPLQYFREMGGPAMHEVDGIQLGSWHSFPSGHTAAAFTLFVSLAILNKNKTLGLFFVLLAVMAGMARIYLAQHFYEDVYFGALAGTFSAFFTHLLLMESAWYRSKWTRGSLLDRLKR